MDCKEIRDVVGYEGLYGVTKNGQVWSYKLNRFLRHGTRYDVYQLVTLTKDEKSRIKSVHRLVAEAFIPNIDKKPQVNHINAIKSDNNLENLEWVTNSENVKHGYKFRPVTVNNSPTKKRISLSVDEEIAAKLNQLPEREKSRAVNAILKRNLDTFLVGYQQFFGVEEKGAGK